MILPISAKLKADLALLQLDPANNQLLINKFFDPSIPAERRPQQRGKK